MRIDSGRRIDLLIGCLAVTGRIIRREAAAALGVSADSVDKDVQLIKAIMPDQTRLMARGSLPAPLGVEAMPDGVGVADVLRVVLGERFVAVEIEPRPDPDLSVAKVVADAVREGRVMSCRYVSPSAEASVGSERRISPHTVVDADGRLHARAYDHADGRFKDFVLGRMSAARLEGPSTVPADRDDEWNEIVDLVLEVDHPDVDTALLIAREIGADPSTLTRRISCRKALVSYVEPVHRTGRYARESAVRIRRDGADA